MQLSIFFLLVASVAAWGHTSAAAEEIIIYDIQDKIRHREMIYAAIRKIRKLPRRQRLQAESELKIFLTRMQQAYARSEAEQERIRLEQDDRRARFTTYHGF